MPQAWKKYSDLEKQSRDQLAKLRQCTEEIDMLKYHNDRLTKRIEVMQSEESQHPKVPLVQKLINSLGVDFIRIAAYQERS